MKRKKYYMIAFLFCMGLGILLHFTYKISNYNQVIGLFSPVNESVWEHLKLLFYPMLCISIIFYLKDRKNIQNYWFAKMLGILAAMMFVVVFFYTYTGIIGKNYIILDIGSFAMSILLGEYVMYKILRINKLYKLEIFSLIILFIILYFFIIFTKYPPRIPLFEDPVYGTFGEEPKRID